MRTFYKYMPYSTLIKFLNDPCFRVTPSSCQNDPFEFGYSSSDIDILNLKGRGRKLGNNLEDFSKLHGIVSLTTSKENILMWSHYADNHRGAVVEIYIDDEKPQSVFVNSTGPVTPPFEYQDFLFDKVVYSSNRRFSQIGSEDSLEKIKYHYYFTKAEDWNFEEEYRFITPMSWINRILFNESGYEKAKKILGNFSSSIACVSESDSNSKFYELDPATIDIIYVRDFHLIAQLWMQSNGSDIMFFIRLNKGTPGNASGYIGRIFLGCQANNADFISQLRVGGNNPFSIMGNYSSLLTGDVKGVLIGEIDRDEYKLSFNPLVGNIRS